MPLRLRNAPTKLMKDLGYGKGYRYAHDEAGGYAAGETYLPDGMARPGWYDPTDRGFESRIRDRLPNCARAIARAARSRRPLQSLIASACHAPARASAATAGRASAADCHVASALPPRQGRRAPPAQARNRGSSS